MCNEEGAARAGMEAIALLISVGIWSGRGRLDSCQRNKSVPQLQRETF